MPAYLATSSVFLVHGNMNLKHTPLCTQLPTRPVKILRLDPICYVKRLLTWLCGTPKPPYDRAVAPEEQSVQRVHSSMENSAFVSKSGLWELLLTWLLLQPPAGVSGATATTEL